MFLPLFTIFTGWMLFQAVTKGPRVALWNGWLLAMLMLPVWMVRGFGSVALDFRTGAAMTGIFGFVLSSKEKLVYKFALVDVLVVCLFLTHLISGFSNREMSIMTIPNIARIWLLPYFAGRLFLSSIHDIKKFLPVVAVILIILSASNVFEAVTKTNVLCKAFGKRYPILEAGEGYRWGIKRAQGPLDHPIFNGLMLVMIYPFAVEAGRQAIAGKGPKWWMILPFTCFLSVVCTASRGPIIAALVAVMCTVVFSSKFRVPLLIAVIGLGIAGYKIKDAIKDAVASLAESDDFERWVEIDGQEYRYTGTAHRELLFLVYKKAMRECKFFGYGARLRGVPIAEHLQDRFSSIDNHYLLFFLQRGYAGLYLFIGISGITLIYLLGMTWNRDLPQSGMCGAMVGSLLGVSMLLLSVWFAPDHGSVWLFFVGFVACMQTLDPNEVDEEALLEEELRKKEEAKLASAEGDTTHERHADDVAAATDPTWGPHPGYAPSQPLPDSGQRQRW